jgi:pyruvate,orthophosphate dikinase
MNRVCLVACDTLHIDEARRVVRLGDRDFVEGDLITLDGNEGLVYAGQVAAVNVVDEVLLARLAALREVSGPGPAQKPGKHKHQHPHQHHA